MRQGRYSEAITEFSTAVKTADLWLARFDLGVAYVEAGRYAEAISELEVCVKRRGEATALSLANGNTIQGNLRRTRSSCRCR
jgi:Flp pilus assembly protein TadD